MSKNRREQVFYDPSGKRWRMSLVFFCIFGFVLSVLAALMINNIFALYSINSSIRGLTYGSNGSNLSDKSEIITTFGYNYENFANLRENFENIDRLVLAAGKIENDNGFEYKLRKDDATDSIDKFINDNNSQKTRYSLISDIDYNKDFYEFRDESYIFTKLIKSRFYEDFAQSLITANKQKGHSGFVLDIRESTIKQVGYGNFSEFSSFLKTKLAAQNQDLFIKLPLSIDSQNIKRIIKDFDGVIISLDFGKQDFNELGKLNSTKEKLTNILPDLKNKSYFLDLPTESLQYVFYEGGDYDIFPISYNSVGELIENGSLEIKNQQNSLASFVEYTDEEGFEKKILIRDSIYLHNLLTSLISIDKTGFNGYGIANFNSEDPQVWDILLSNNISESKEILTKFRFTNNVETFGKGQITIPLENRVDGEREINFLGDYIISQKITKFPKKSKVEFTGDTKNKIALTFDDGPHPIYTAQILDVLKEKQVKATFFLLGQNILKYPELTNRIVNEGHEIANHTYTHPRTYSLDKEEFKNEVVATSNIIKEVTGVDDTLVRIPFSDTSLIETERDLIRHTTLNELGLIDAGYDVDSKDWELNDKQKILDRVFSHDLKNSNQILLHDGGSSRISTVESLPEIIDRLKSENIDIVKVGELNIKSDNLSLDANSKSNQLYKNIGFVFQSSVSMFLSLYLFLFLLFAILRFIVLWVLNFFAVFGKNSTRFSALGDNPMVSILIACYNEEKIIKRTVESALNSYYSNIEIIVVNDGSTDKSREILESNFGNNKKVRILNIPNGGKSGAINHAIGFAKGEYIFSIDADTIVLPDTLSHLLDFMTPNVGAIAGNIQVGNDNNILTKNQRLEYIGAQNFDKIGYGVLNTIMVVPGALGLWRKKAVIEAGFYHKDTLAEDADLTIRILKKGWKVKYNRNAVAITEAPDTLSSLIKQRVRWSYGTLQTIYKHRDMLFNKKYGWFGFLVIPEVILTNLFLLVTIINNLFLISVIVKLISSLTNTSLYFGSFFESADVYAIIFYMCVFLLLYLMTIILAMSRDKSNNRWYLLLHIPFNVFVYRQMLWFVNLWVLIKAVKGRRALWNHFEKKGNMLLKIEKTNSKVLAS